MKDSTMTYLEHYLKGSYEQVWDQLTHPDFDIHQDDLRADALEVARETMRRVRTNIEMLIERLLQMGFLFGYDRRLQQQLYHLSSASNRRDYFDLFSWVREQPPVFLAANQLDDERREWEHEFARSEDHPFGDDFVFTGNEAPVPMKIYLEQIEQIAGPLPLSLRAWYEEVGAVNFYGYHERWHALIQTFAPTLYNRGEPSSLYLMSYCDPLQVCALDEHFLTCWREKIQYETIYKFEFAPDADFKDGYGGSSSPYTMILPDASADVRLIGTGMTFVQYLRVSLLSWGGFIGMRKWPTVPKGDLAVLTRDLIPF